MIGNNIGQVSKFPPQKKSTSSKNPQWYKDCIDASLSLAYLDQGESKRKMQVYTDLDNDIIDVNEIEAVFNPLNIEYASFPASLKNYPLSVPKIDLLQGEEIKRRFEYSIQSKNENTYSSHQSQLQEMLMDILTDELTKGSFDEEDAERRLQKFSKYSKYEWKDTHEITATRIVEYLFQEQDLKYKFNEGIRNALVQGQEIYRVDSIGNEPSVVRCNPKNIYTLRRGDSERIEDSDIITEISYIPIGAVIDEFYDDLKSTEITKLENGEKNTISSGSSVLNYSHRYPTIYSNLDPGGAGDGFLPLSDFNDNYNTFSLPYDVQGNVRVVRTRWRGMRKIGRVTYFDENGDEQTRLVPEDYKIDETLGETVKWLWISEAYEGTLIADDIYLKLQPREVQMRHFDNISKCFLGYVGTDYGKSLMSRMEPYQYLYNVYMRRLELVLSKYKGPIYELDVSKVPDDWEMDKWLYYADVLGWAIVDPFNEGKKGSATGKLAGNFNTSGKVLDPNVGNYIQQIVMMLQYIETQMGEIAGVTKQRQGQIDNRETVGGVERSVTQSSHITEKWFFIHDETKRRVLQALLDTAKYTWRKSKSKKLNYVLDDMSRVFLDFSPADIASSEFDLFISNSRKDLEIKQFIQQLAQAGIQNGLGMSAMIKVLREDSVTAMARGIDEAEELSFQRENEAAKKQSEAAQQQAQMEMADKEKDRELEYYKIDTEAQVKREDIAARQQSGQQDKTYLEQEKIRLAERKQSLEENKLSTTTSNDVNKFNKDFNLKQKQLNETVRHNKETEKISRIKKPSK
jgi:hypothetical protein